MQPETLLINDSSWLRIDQIAQYVRNSKTIVTLDHDADYTARIQRNRQFLETSIASGQKVYGVTTGFGSSSRNALDPELAKQLQKNLIQYHGCGVGSYLSEEECAATLLVRLNCLAKGYSGVSMDLLHSLESFLQMRLIPAIRSQGSVGASGDLTPLSYVASCLQGDRVVYEAGSLVETAKALELHRLRPYVFKEREALAIMNGTSAMTGVAAIAWADASAIADQACTLTGMLVELLSGLSAPFARSLHERKPHPGQVRAAGNILSYLNSPESRYYRTDGDDGVASGTGGIQDCYSIRCAPQVIGVLYDVLDWTKGIIETEINSVNDNPVIMDREEQILNGGLFFGGHIAAACDALKAAVTNVVNLADRQLALMMSDRVRNSLPENLVATFALGDSAKIHHGFKAMQITMSALAAECVKNAAPMGILSRPTESSNQDVVSMGTIAARDLRLINDMAQNALAIHTMAVRQGFYVTKRNSASIPLNAAAQAALEKFGRAFSPVIQDRYLDDDIQKMRTALFTNATSTR